MPLVPVFTVYFVRSAKASKKTLAKIHFCLNYGRQIPPREFPRGFYKCCLARVFLPRLLTEENVTDPRLSLSFRRVCRLSGVCTQL